MILHSINKTAALEQCARVLKPGDAVVLLEDGVYLLLTPKTFADAGVSWFAIAADVALRGLQNQVPEGVRLIDYRQFVELTVEAEKTCNWC